MSIGWQYLLLFFILTAPLVFWAWHTIGKTLDREGYIDREDIGLDDK